MEDIEKRFSDLASKIDHLETRLSEQAETIKKLSKKVADVGEGLDYYIDSHGETHSKNWDRIGPFLSMAQAAFFVTHPEAMGDIEKIHKITGEPDESGYDPKR